MKTSNFPPAASQPMKGMKVAAAKAPPAVKMAPAVKVPKARAGLDKAHNPANQLSRQQGYSNGGLVKDMSLSGSSMGMGMNKDKDMGLGLPGYANGGVVKGKKGC